MYGRNYNIEISGVLKLEKLISNKRIKFKRENDDIEN